MLVARQNGIAGFSFQQLAGKVSVIGAHHILRALKCASTQSQLGTFRFPRRRPAPWQLPYTANSNNLTSPYPRKAIHMMVSIAPMASIVRTKISYIWHDKGIIDDFCIADLVSMRSLSRSPAAPTALHYNEELLTIVCQEIDPKRGGVAANITISRCLQTEARYLA